MKHLITSLLAFFLCSILLSGKTITDKPDTDISTFFHEKGATYVVKYAHKSNQQVKMAEGITLQFKGGSLEGDLQFNRTTLKGKVKLQGSKVKGTIANRCFEAHWLCWKDGKHDDAAAINNLIEVFDSIHFSKGVYLLESFHTSKYKVNKPYHLGINRSNVHLEGANGAVLKTRTMAGVVNVYTKPNDIVNTVSNISFRRLNFTVESEATEFDSYQEHCHTISFMGAKDVLIEDCTFNNFWGDAVCTNHYGDNLKTGERSRNENIRIIDNRFEGYKGNNRNGVSIINGKNIVVEDNFFVNCSNAKMPGAIDVEPNFPFYTCQDLIIRGNIIKNCQGECGAISFVVCNKDDMHIKNVLIEKNRIVRSRRGIEIAVEEKGSCDNVVVRNNTIDKYTDPYVFYGKGKATRWVWSNNKIYATPKGKFGGSIKFE